MLVLLHQVFQKVADWLNRDVTRNKGCPLIDLFSSMFAFGPLESSISPGENRGLRVPVNLECWGPEPRAPPKDETSQSNDHITSVTTIVTAMIARNRVRHTPNRSCGRRPTA